MTKRTFSFLLVLAIMSTLFIGCRRVDAVVSVKEAKTIALADAGLTEEQVTWLRTEPDRENGKVVYDISFRYDGVEYEYDIDVKTGDIAHKDVDHNGQPTTTTTAAVTTTTAVASAASVTAEQAQAIALADAGFTAEQVTHLSVEPDRDDGKSHFDVRFFKDNTEYEYEIDAGSGNIVSVDKDIDQRG